MTPPTLLTPNGLRIPFFAALFASGLFSTLPDRCLAQELTSPLPSSEVQCQEDQLAAILGRMRITGAGPTGPQEDGIPWALYLAPGRAAGTFSGLGLSAANLNNPPLFDPRPLPIERHLAFRVTTQPEQLLLGPSRPRLPQATIVREEPATNLVAPSSEFRLVVSLDTGFSGTQGPIATINNLLAPSIGRPYNGFLTSSTQPGRGLLAVAGTLCSKDLTDQDHQILEILRRMLRFTPVDADDGCDSCAGNASHEVALFRGEDPHEFLFNAYPYRHRGTRLGRLSGRVIVEWDASGKLTTGSLEVFRRCLGGENRRCNDTPLDVVASVGPPGFPGFSHPPTSQLGFVFVSYLAGAASPPQPVAVPFATFLSQSTWN